MMKKLRYKNYNKQITTPNNRNVQSLDQEESKWNSNINVNSIGLANSFLVTLPLLKNIFRKVTSAKS